MIGNVIQSVFTLYMLLILLRWFAPFLELNVNDIRFRWIAQLVDPVVGTVRRILPSLGPMDLGPLATLFLVWVVREVALTVVYSGGVRAIGG